MKFPLGRITAQDHAARFLELSGQDADFFLDKHASGDWGEDNAARNERALLDGYMVMSTYRTLRGQKLFVLTTADRSETRVWCAWPEIKLVPLPDRMPTREVP
jgi:hypothetical protein